MKKLLKDSAGITAIAVVLIVIIGIAAGGATILAVRMLVTGEDYLAPFEELGWISSDDDEEVDKKEDSKSNSKDEDTKKVTTLEDDSRLSSEAKKSGVTQYYGSVTSAEMMEADTTDDYYDLYNSMELEINVFATDDKVVEIVFHMDLSKCLKVMYEQYGDELSTDGDEYNSYEEFEEEMLPYLEEMIETMLVSDEEMSDYVDIYTENGILEMYITEEGFDSLYDTYDIEPDSADVDVIIDSIEESFGITLKEI